MGGGFTVVGGVYGFPEKRQYENRSITTAIVARLQQDIHGAPESAEALKASRAIAFRLLRRRCL
jgi:hypothetical protein